MFGLGLPELIVILVLVLLLFGGKKLPELSKSVADGIKELRRGFSDDTSKPAAPAAPEPDDKTDDSKKA